MDKVKKYILQLFGDYNITSYLFDYDVIVTENAEKAARKIAAIIRSHGYEIEVLKKETEKNNYPVWRIQFLANGCVYKIYVLHLSDGTTRVMATRRDPLWSYVITPLVIFSVAIIILYTLLFANMNYLLQGVVFIVLSLLAWAYIRVVEGKFSRGVADLFREITEYAVQINRKKNAEFASEEKL